MRNGWSAAEALILAGWRSRWNLDWRFSKWKAGLWKVALELALTALVLWRSGVLGGEGALQDSAGFPAAGMAGGLGGALVLILTQSGLWSFLSLVLESRRELYGEGFQTLVHLSPAPSLSIILARVGGRLTRRVWTQLVWTGMLLSLVPASQRWWGAPLLWATGVAMGTLGELVGLVLLISWVKVVPQFFRATWVAVLVMQMLLLYGFIYLVATGIQLEQVGVQAKELQGPTLGLLGLLFGLPGLLAVLTLTRRPGAVGEAYREGWLQLAELEGAGGSVRRSMWPVPVPGAGAALTAKDWLYAARNRLTLVRLGLIVIGCLVAVPVLPRFASVDADRQALVLLGGTLGLLHLTVGEMGAALFNTDLPNLGLLATTGLTPKRALAGKLLAALPLAGLAVLTAGAVAWLADSALDMALWLGLRAGLIQLGMVGIMVGASACDVGYGERTSSVPAEMAAALEQAPQGVGAFIGWIGAALVAAGSLWWGGTMQVILPVVLSSIALLFGYWRLHRVLGGDGLAR